MTIKTIKDLKQLLETSPDDLDISELFKKHEPEIKIVNNELPTEIPLPDSFYPVFKHSVNPGDLIAAMGCLKKYYEATKRKVILAQAIGIVAAYYPGAVHPTVDEQGRNVTFNQYMWDMMKPLVESQEYVHSFEKYEGQNVSIDLDVIRGKTFVNLPHGPIQGWLPIAYPDLSFDMSKPWIILNGECPEYIRKQVKRKIIANFTDRYREQTIEYYFLRNYAPDLIFAGTKKEHFDFCNRWQVNCPYLEVDSFLDLAHAIKECRFLISNQSMCWGIAQAMQVPRVLEMCRFADNCFPGIGENSYGSFYQLGIDYAFRVMYNKTA